MNTNLTPIQFMQTLRQNPSPQQFLMNMLNQQAGNNPIFANLLQLAQNKDGRGIEQVARNMMKERGLDFDTEFNSFRNMFGL